MSNCTALTVQIVNDTVGAGFAALGFILGLLLGFIICFFLLWICCCHRKFASKHYNALCLVRIRCPKVEACCHEKVVPCCCATCHRKTAVDAEEQSNPASRTPSPLLSRPQTGRRRTATDASGSRSNEAADGDATMDEESLVDFCLAAVLAHAEASEQPGALIDVITQTTEYGGEQQLAQQDCLATEQLERELTRHRLSAFAQLCWVLLNSLAKQKLLDDAGRDRLQRELLGRLRQQKRQLDDELQKRRQAVADDKRLDEEARAAELSRLATWHGSQLGERLASELDRLGRDAGRQAELDEQQLDELLQRHKTAAGKLEERLQQHRLRQSNALEEALARRRLLLAEQKAADEEVQYDMELRMQSREQQLERLQRDGAVADSKRVLSEYRMALLRHKEAFEKDYLQQQQTLAVRLRQLRSQQEQEAGQQYAQAAARLTEAVEAATMTDAAVFLDEHFATLEEHATRRQRQGEQLDDKDCNQLALLRDDLSQEKRNAEAATEEALRKHLPMEEEDWGRLLDQHRGQTERLRQRRRQQQKQQLRQLEEKLAQRQSQLSDSLSERESELVALEKSQEVVLKKSLAFQLDMDEAMKRRVLEEHHRSMVALGNSLQVSRLKQEKRLEAKIAARKAKIGELRRQCRDSEAAAADDRQVQKAREELQRREDEERRQLEAESRAGRQRLRDELAKETEEALKSQESQLGLVIARLQTGQARRRNIIDKQDRILQDLQAQLEAKVTGGEASSPSELDQILHSHRNQVASLSEQMQRERRQQEQQLAERLQRRQMEKEEEVKDIVEQEEKSASKALDLSGHGKVARFALELSLDSKFRTSMMQMEEEMRLEMKRQQEELDREMEADLQAALEEQRKQLLSQLARVTNISQSEMKQMVAQAGETSGAGRRLTRQVSTEIEEAGRAAAAAAADERWQAADSRRARNRNGKRYEMDY